MLSVDPAGVGGLHCPPVPERLTANRVYIAKSTSHIPLPPPHFPMLANGKILPLQLYRNVFEAKNPAHLTKLGGGRGERGGENLVNARAIII